MNGHPVESPEDTLKAAFTTALQLPHDVPASWLEYGITDGWDSIAHMVLIAEIESAFDVMLSTDEVIGMSSFENARQILKAKGICFGDQV